MSLLPVESQLLIATAGGSSMNPVLAELGRGPVQWDAFLVLAEWERTLPVSWRRLQEAGVVVPPETGEAFRRLSLVTTFSLEHLEDRLVALLKVYNDAGIDAILLKGSGLGLSVYPGFTERPMGDVDVLVDTGQARRAWDLALSNGWHWDEQQYPANWYETHHHLPPLLDPARTGAQLELHTALNLHGHPFDLDFKAAASVSLQHERRGVRFRTLDAEHAIVHLSVHFGWAHVARFGIWRLIRDVCALVERGVNWDRLVEVAAGRRASLPVYWSLELCRSLAGVPIPDSTMVALRPLRAEWVRRLVRRHLAMHAIGSLSPCPSEGARRWVWSLAMTDSSTRVSGSTTPWDSEPRPSVVPPLIRRAITQLMSIPRWWQYGRLLAQPHGAASVRK
jgi:hypothetical protein